jgi:glutaminase
MAKTVTEGRRPDASADADAIYRTLFDSFNPDKDGRISPLEVLSRLRRCGLQPDDPRIAEALAGLAGADGGSRQISFTQFKGLARHNSSLIRRAVEGNLAVPDFAALTADITRIYDELLPVRPGAVAGYIPQLRRVDPEQLAIAVCTVDGQRFSAGDAATAFSLQSVSKTVSYCLALGRTVTAIDDGYRCGQSTGCQRRNVAPWSSAHSASSPNGRRTGASAWPPAARTRSTAAARSSTR